MLKFWAVSQRWRARAQQNLLPMTPQRGTPLASTRFGRGSLALGLLVGTGVVVLAASQLLQRPAADRHPPLALPAAAAATPADLDAAKAPADMAERAPVLPAHLPGTPEGRLIHVYRTIAEQRMDAALVSAQELATAMPGFRLAQLVYADLLATRGGHAAGFGSELSRGGPQAGAELEAMREEALLRLAALRERPPANALPSQFVMLPPGLPHAIAVDVSRARLYLFENSPQGLKLKSDHYVSVGKQGADKLMEGDQRTPLGVYFISDAIDPSTLEDRFGSGALPLNYPNPLDRADGRTGSGILLHGVPSNTYSRAPRSTDGCVALANDDLKTLAATIAPRGTPVVIAQQLQWVPPGSHNAESQAFLQVLAAWQQARLANDTTALAGFEAALPADTAAPRRSERRTRSVAGFDDLAVLAWKGRQDVMVVSFRERDARGHKARRTTRQYWARGQGGWKILPSDA